MKTRLIGLLIASFGIGCGDGDGAGGLDGIYEITSHTLTGESCAGTPTEVTDDTACFQCVLTQPYFKIKTQTFFGQTIRSAIECESATACDDSDDPDTIDLSGPIFEFSRDGKFVGEAAAAATGGAGCSYTLAVFTLEETDTGVMITRTESRLSPDSPSAALGGDDCLDLVDNPPPAAELDCEEREEIQGVMPDSM